MHEIVTERISVGVGDGTQMGGYLARPARPGTYPGLLVLQEIFGVNAHIRDIAERFAREGYVALAPELFHRSAPGYEGRYDDIQGGMAQATKLTPAGVEADLAAAHGYLQGHASARRDRIGVVGYCMGGRLAFLANARLPLQAAVSYYGGGIATALLPLADTMAGPLLLVWAGQDGYIPPEHRRSVAEALRAAGKPFVDVEFSHADHGFFCDARSNYEPRAARQVWALTLAFLAAHLQDDAAR
jgi:carboxymethylenebutenolidase